MIPVTAIMITTTISEAGSKKDTHAFTLFESMLVLAIIGTILIISVPLFTRFTERTKLETAARDVSSALNTARSFAIRFSSEDYYVVFDTTDPDNHAYYVGTNMGGVEEDIFTLPRGVSFSTIQFSGGQADFSATGALEDTLPNCFVQLSDGNETITVGVEKTTGKATITQN